MRDVVPAVHALTSFKLSQQAKKGLVECIIVNKLKMEAGKTPPTPSSFEDAYVVN